MSLEADQKDDSPILPPKKQKLKPSVNFDQNKFSTYFSLFKKETNTAIQEDEQQNSIDEENEAEVKSFLATENLSAETEEDKSGT